MKKIAFVIPWYGENIPGGAETAARNLAEKMAQKGENIEVLTTTVKDFNSNWSTNYHNPGTETINKVIVKRFKVRKRDHKSFDEINLKLMNNKKITYEEEKIFLREMVNSPDLENYISKNKAYYKSIIFIPYMFGTTYFGIKNSIDKAILIPAFHDESYAYFQHFRELYSKVQGLIFFSDAEKEWAEANLDLFGVKNKVIGLGIKEFISDPEDFKEKFNIKKPFILYAGRKDSGKNVHILIEYFERYKMEYKNDLQLVLIGGGSIDIPESIKDSVIDLGFLEEQDKFNAYSAAEFLCNPSPNESFSIVIMESWYSGKPVLVNENCKVTKRFCEVSNGGLYYSNYEEFSSCINLLNQNQYLSNKLGGNGKRFVEKKFKWEKVIDNYIDFINNI